MVVRGVISYVVVLCVLLVLNYIRVRGTNHEN